MSAETVQFSQLMTPADVAAALRVTVRTVRFLTVSGRIAVRYVGRLPRYEPAAVARFVAALPSERPRRDAEARR